MISIWFDPLCMAIEPDANEPDDSLETAKVIPITVPDMSVDDSDYYQKIQSHNFHQTGDEDWVKFYAKPGQTYRISVTEPGALCNPVIMLYDKNGTGVIPKEIDDHKAGQGEYTDWDCDPDGYYHCTEDVYYAVIKNNDSNAGEGTEYTLILSKPSAPFAGLLQGMVYPCCIQAYLVADFNGKRYGESMTLPNGSYYMPASSGTFLLTVQAQGYHKFNEMVTINEIGSTEFDIHLTPLSQYIVPVADFKYNKEGLKVNFKDLSTGSVASRHWDFGDGNVSSVKDPDHTYTDSGQYKVSLTVRGTNGNDTVTKKDHITVNSSEENDKGSGCFISITGILK